MSSSIVILAGVLVLVGLVQHSTAQPLCGVDGDPINKLCVTVLEELLRRGQEYPDPPRPYRENSELLENGLPFPRGTKRQDVDHVFLRFGR